MEPIGSFSHMKTLKLQRSGNYRGQRKSEPFCTSAMCPVKKAWKPHKDTAL